MGLATVSAAASLGNILYGDHRWLFRLTALLWVGLGLMVYFRRSGVCSLEAAKRRLEIEGWRRNFSPGCSEIKG